MHQRLSYHFIQHHDMYGLLNKIGHMRSVSALKDSSLPWTWLPLTKDSPPLFFPVRVLAKAEALAIATETHAGLVYRVYVKCRCDREVPFGKMGQHFGSQRCRDYW